MGEMKIHPRLPINTIIGILVNTIDRCECEIQNFYICQYKFIVYVCSSTYKCSMWSDRHPVFSTCCCDHLTHPQNHPVLLTTNYSKNKMIVNNKCPLGF